MTESDLIFSIKQFDTRPILRRQLLDSEDVAVNLTGATVRFTMVSKAGVKLIDDAVCTVTDAANGWIEYAWVTGDTNTAGYHRGHFRVEYSPSNFESFPNTDYLQIEIEESL